MPRISSLPVHLIERAIRERASDTVGGVRVPEVAKTEMFSKAYGDANRRRHCNCCRR